MYPNAAGITPIMRAFLGKGVPPGTALAFTMSVIGLSFPETIILRKVLKPQLIAVFVEVYSAGTNPAPRVHPKAATVMREAGINGNGRRAPYQSESIGTNLTPPINLPLLSLPVRSMACLSELFRSKFQ